MTSNVVISGVPSYQRYRHFGQFNPLVDAHRCHTRIAIKHPVPDRVPICNFDIRALWRSALSVRVPGCQKLKMTGLTRSGTACFIAVPLWQRWASNG